MKKLFNGIKRLVNGAVFNLLNWRIVYGPEITTEKELGLIRRMVSPFGIEVQMYEPGDVGVTSLLQ